jgi:sister chromatid cohesion protein PDS5
MDQPAYRLAVQVCNATADKLQRHVCQYFTDIIVEHAPEDDLEDVQSAHNLIKRLNSSCQGLLHNVIPQLEEELRVLDVQIRVMGTQTLGDMFADKGGSDLVRKYPTTWATWLSRAKDQAVVVRQAFVESSKGVLVNMNLPEPREQVGGTFTVSIPSTRK